MLVKITQAELEKLAKHLEDRAARSTVCATKVYCNKWARKFRNAAKRGASKSKSVSKPKRGQRRVPRRVPKKRTVVSKSKKRSR